MATNIEMNILQSNGTTYETLYPKTSTSNLEGILSSSQLPSSIPASKISGTLSTSNIPNLSASKITSGTLGTARIPSLDASKIGSGTLPVSRGGTGNTSLSGLKTDLGVESTNNILSYSKGAYYPTKSYYVLNDDTEGQKTFPSSSWLVEYYVYTLLNNEKITFLTLTFYTNTTITVKQDREYYIYVDLPSSGVPITDLVTYSCNVNKADNDNRGIRITQCTTGSYKTGVEIVGIMKGINFNNVKIGIIRKTYST